jgi:hypothetical protein
MKRFEIEGFSKYSFGLDGSVLHIRKNNFIKGSFNKGYIEYGLISDYGFKKSLRKHQIVYKLFNQDYKLFQSVKLVIDHINSNKLDNHISNLQLVSQRENLSKERTIKSGLPTGVYFEKSRNKYISQIFIDGKTKKLGRFSTPQEASDVYQQALNNIKSKLKNKVI